MSTVAQTVIVATPLPLTLDTYFLVHQGEWNVPQRFLKNAVWVPYQRNKEGTPGYFTQLYHDNPNSLYLVEFNFDLITWVDVRYSNSNLKWYAYRLTDFPTLYLMEEEQNVVRSDWGPLDGQEDPLASEPEQIEPLETHEETSGNEADNEDIHIPTTDLLNQEEQHLATLAGCIPAEEITQTPIIPRPPSRKDILPTFTTVMATTTQTYAPTITRAIGGGIPLGPPSGSGSGGGGGGGGGGPGGGLARYGKLSGNPPRLFNGDRTTSVGFLLEWELYYEINQHVDVMNQPYTRSMLFLTYIQGDDVQNWVMKQVLWLRNEVNEGGVQPTNEWLWRETLHMCGHACLNTMNEARARLELSKLKMMGGDIDGFIAKFERLASLLTQFRMNIILHVRMKVQLA